MARPRAYPMAGAAALPRVLGMAALLASVFPPVAAQAVQPPVPVYVHVMAPGDTLIGLGQRLLAEPARWPEVARLNQVRNERRMPVGMALQIPLHLLRTEPAPAAVLSVTGAVHSGGAAVSAGQVLQEGEQLDTGEQGLVTVRLVDGTLLRLRGRGQLQVDLSRRVPGTDGVRSGVQLQRGRVEIEAAPARAGQPGFRIGTPQGVLGVRGTVFRVEAGADGLTRGEVLEGTVAVSGRSSAATETALTAGFGAVVDATGAVAPPQPLLPAPGLDGAPALHERPLVRLVPAVVAGAVAYRVQVASDESFDVVLAEARAAVDPATGVAELRIRDLPDGRYPMRVRAIAADGLEGRDARATLMLKARPEPPLPSEPQPGAERVSGVSTFAWSASSEARSYRLQVARADDDEFARPLHDVKGIEGARAELPALPAGAYLWRVASVRADGDQGPFGDEHAFRVRELPPQPAAPAAPSVGDQTIRFFWGGQPGQRFDFQLARDAAFEQIVDQRTLDRTDVELPRPGSGRYHMRVRVRDSDGYVGPWSATQHFDVVACARSADGACVSSGGGPLQTH